MKPSNADANACAYASSGTEPRRRLIAYGVDMLLVLLTLASALATGLASEAQAEEKADAEKTANAMAAENEATDFAWHPLSCRVDRLHASVGSTAPANPANLVNPAHPSYPLKPAHPATPDEAVFVDAEQARKALTTTGIGRLEINSLQSQPLIVHVFRPSRFDARTGRIWFVMHGTSRNAKDYLKYAAPMAERYQVLALAPEFSRKDYPSGEAYTLGVVSRGRADARAAAEGRWRSPQQMPYAEIDRTFDAVKTTLRNQQRGYFIFGHSAGAQFVHRLLTFAHCPRVLGAVAANAGWYTLPTTDASFPAFPYSLRGTPPAFQDPRPLLAAPLTLLLGTKDMRGNEEDPHLRASTGAMIQGPNRLARGRFYHQQGVQAARDVNTRLGWTLQLADGAGHEAAEVIAPAAQRLFAPVGEKNHSEHRLTPAAALASAYD